MAGVLGTLGVVSRFLEARRQGETRPISQVTQVTVVGAVIEDGIPSLRGGVTLCVWRERRGERKREREGEREREESN